MRKIEFPTYPNEKGEPQNDFGYFHEWTKDEKGNIKAVIERMDGTVILANYCDVKFMIPKSMYFMEKNE